ncbi:hypothetical protein BV22DRAFT_1101408 [Leucogyrophana mollusca]|uniref:Uncharacterized protein n=1 Tax=Leucogyrophana mollusca TaxID=85980 RepID=A0ACB8BZP6_9AGAM|nr:hypothetical protein BV22DRAFT_1101408 [Leucogyrophana mollusca]
MIARCRAKSWIVQLREENNSGSLPNVQRGMRGHIIVYPQEPGALATILPPTLEEMTTPICVLFVGSSPPTEEWLRLHAKPLIVRREKVRDALVWLKEHNKYYKDIEINNRVLDSLEDEHTLPVHIEHIIPSGTEDRFMSRYDANPQFPSRSEPEEHAEPLPFQNVVVANVDGNAPSNELRAAALRHVKRNAGGYVEIPHGQLPVNEFVNPGLFPMIYPTLYPYGIGGCENPMRSAKLSMKRHIKHLALFFLIHDIQYAPASGVIVALEFEGK